MQYTFVEKTGSARTAKETNIRQGNPSTSGLVVGNKATPAGTVLDYVGWVTDGENVSGNSRWFKDKDSNYFWSGNVIEIMNESSGMLVPKQLKQILPNLPDDKCVSYVSYLLKVGEEFGINTPARIAAFIAQTAHESAGYSVLIENLNYSAQALLATWPSRFTAENISLYARQPQKIANHAYASRYGNGDEASGDGWRYRGRGIIQITFRDNYKACGGALNLDLITSPELLEQPLHAFRSGAWYWSSRKLNTLADKEDFVGITKAINGGLNGLDDRMKYYEHAKAILGVA